MSKTCCGGKSGAVLKVKKADCSGSGTVNVDMNQETCGSNQAPEQNAVIEPCRNVKRLEADYITGYLQTAAGEVPQFL